MQYAHDRDNIFVNHDIGSHNRVHSKHEIQVEYMQTTSTNYLKISCELYLPYSSVRYFSSQIKTL